MMQEEESAMTAAKELPCPISSSDGQEEEGSGSRSICWDGCGRPVSICICPYLPPVPIPTSTTVLILHHPHELRHNKKLSTLPALSRCLRNSHLTPGRKLHPNSHPLLSRAHSAHLFLFPSPAAIPIADWAREASAEEKENPLLIVFDGTWAHVREMVTASRGFLEGFARGVSVARMGEEEGPSTYESEMVMRKEPAAGCMSTMEAVARALRVLEPDKRGAEVEERLVEVLREMVGFQKRHLRPMERRRRRMGKKKAEKVFDEITVREQESAPGV